MVGAGFAITAEMVQPVIDGITGTITNITPAGLTIMAALMSVGVIATVIRKFV